MADPAVPSTPSKIGDSIKKHKVAWIIGAIIGVIIIYYIIRMYSGGSSNQTTTAQDQLGTGAAGYSGTSPVSVTGIQGPPGPPGRRGPRGPKGPPGKKSKDIDKKPHPKTNVSSVAMLPNHMMPTHTAGNSTHPDPSHAIKGP